MFLLASLARPSCTSPALGLEASIRRQWQKASFASNARPPFALAYPERLLIYHTPTPVTAFIGLIRAGTIVFFGLGCLFIAPGVAFNDDAPNWLVPVVIAGAAVPMTLVHLMTVPYVVNVFIRPPNHARRSKETINAFARRLPPDTRLEFQTMGLLPLPRTRGALLSEVRTLPPSKKRLANLELVPGGGSGERRSMWRRMTQGYLYTGPSKRNWEKTGAPGVWQLVFDQIIKNTERAVHGSTSARGPSTLNAGQRVGNSRGDRRLPAANNTTPVPRPQQLRKSK
ncbi:hypothetical protein MBLNU459_g8145t1 [Dothideomycetes sp. NU459]